MILHGLYICKGCHDSHLCHVPQRQPSASKKCVILSMPCRVHVAVHRRCTPCMLQGAKLLCRLLNQDACICWCLGFSFLRFGQDVDSNVSAQDRGDLSKKVVPAYAATSIPAAKGQILIYRGTFGFILQKGPVYTDHRKKPFCPWPYFWSPNNPK